MTKNYIKLGDGNKNAIILSHISHEWDQGAFCKSLANELINNDYTVTILDTLSLVNSKRFSCDIARIAQFINDYVGVPDLACGFAFGGTIIQLMVGDYLSICQKILTISTPSYADDRLKSQLLLIIEQLRKANLPSALALLHRIIGHEHIEIPSIETGKEFAATQRMLIGYERILRCDTRNLLNNYNGYCLALVGEHSSLATVNNVYVPESKSATQQRILVPKANMRVLVDNPEFSFHVIRQWLKTA